MTNEPGEKYTGSPGVTLSVTGLQVQVRRSASTWLELTCHSSCVLSDRPEYVWYKNEENIKRGSSLPVSSGSTDRYSCNLRGSYSHGSPAVYGPQRPSVSVSPSAEMLEGGSVTLTCSADANPAASYTWYKQDGTSDPRLLSEEPQLVFSSIQSSDSGNYSCTAENQLGRKTSEFISIDVKYGPQRPSVSVSPSAEMLEGDSVTLTCSTDANPAANYTWYKEHEDSPRASGQIFTITDFTAEHSGNYYCEAQNEMGRSNSTLLRITSSEKGGSSWSKTTAVAFTSVILLVIIILAAFLLIRKRSRPAERPDNNEASADQCYLAGNTCMLCVQHAKEQLVCCNGSQPNSSLTVGSIHSSRDHSEGHVKGNMEAMTNEFISLLFFNILESKCLNAIKPYK
uniref:Ig-like domain-containing protein n=1 Tax=Gasterosteus aculeatus aculeatus TaxID=481459 RepID=A0AAQ4Q3Q9_GASAC